MSNDKEIPTKQNRRTEEYEWISDEKLSEMAMSGDEIALECIFKRYKNVIKGKANLYFMVGADKDDIIQEGMIGLFWAVRNYDAAKEASFHTFAELCIGRQMISAIKSASRKKHSPLNTSVSLQESINDEDNTASIEETLADPYDAGPEEVVLLQDQINQIEKNITQLFSKLELAVWKEYAKGSTYTEIADSLGKSPKAIDNAIQRMKKKIGKQIEMSR